MVYGLWFMVYGKTIDHIPYTIHQENCTLTKM